MQLFANYDFVFFCSICVAQYAAPSKCEYNAPSHDGKHPALLILNPDFYRTFPTFDIPSLMLHEAEPGHHLQVSRRVITVVSRGNVCLLKVCYVFIEACHLFVEGLYVFIVGLLRVY